MARPNDAQQERQLNSISISSVPGVTLRDVQELRALAQHHDLPLMSVKGIMDYMDAHREDGGSLAPLSDPKVAVIEEGQSDRITDAVVAFARQAYPEWAERWRLEDEADENEQPEIVFGDEDDNTDNRTLWQVFLDSARNAVRA